MRRAVLICSLTAAATAVSTSCGSAGPGRLSLVSMHATAPELVETLAKYYRETLAVDVEILPALQPDASAFDQERQQFVAEALVTLLRDAHADRGRSGAVIGITSRDMYIRRLPWRFAFSLREPPFAVVSYARMDPVALGGPGNRDRLESRLRKMVTRNVGVMIFRLGMNADATTLMYQDVLGVDELDRIDEDLTRAGFPGR
jgi:predicted Zn-dependent protease